MAKHVDPANLAWSIPSAEKRFSFFTIISEETQLQSRIAYDNVLKLWVDPESVTVGTVGQGPLNLHRVGSPTPSRAPVPQQAVINPNGGPKAHSTPKRKRSRSAVKDPSIGGFKTSNPQLSQRKTAYGKRGPSSDASDRDKKQGLRKEKTHSPKEDARTPHAVRHVSARPTRGRSRERQAEDKEVLHQLSKVGKVQNRPQKDPKVYKDFRDRCDKKGYNPSYLRWYCIGSVSQYKPPYPFHLYLEVQKDYQEKLLKQERSQHPDLDDEGFKAFIAKDSKTSWLSQEPHRCKVRNLRSTILNEIAYLQPEIQRAYGHLSLNDLIEAQNNTLAFYDHVFFFRENLIGHSKVISIAMKYFHASLNNRDRAIAWFKDYIEVIKRTLASTEDSYKTALEGLKQKNESLYKENIFLPLLDLENWRTIASTKTRTHYLERVCGSLTARAMALPSRNLENQAYERFKSIISREDPCQVDLTEVRRLARMFGKECIKSGTPPPAQITKLDLGTTACLEYTHSDGGRTAFFRDRFLPWVKDQPQEDEVIHYKGRPVLTIPAGIRRFKSIVPPGVEPPEGELFTDPYPGLEQEQLTLQLFGWPDTCQTGYSPCIGYQLFVYSLSKDCTKDLYTSDGLEYPLVHASPVLEHGGKTRWITIMSMFDSIVQDMAQNQFQPYLLKHPDVCPIFTKSNLAWQMLNKAPPRDLSFHDRMYISDYSNATDAIDHRLARNLLEGFCEGVGMDHESALIGPGIDSLCRPKALMHRRDRNQEGKVPTLTKSGIFMGEPLTKVTLTLLMHVLPLLALASSEKGKKSVEGEEFHQPSWFFYYAPGDDHVATGPDWFLEALAQTSTKLGMLLNKDKTYLTKTFAPLCEQWIYVPNLRNITPTKDIPKDVEVYLRSAWVEILKVKIFSPSSVTEKFYHVEDYSVLGRGKHLSTCLHTMVSSWSNSERENFRDYFIARYLDQLPPKTWWQYHFVFLQTQVGGLGLSISYEEENRHWNKIPALIRKSMVSIYTSDASELWEKLPSIHMPKAVYGYDTSQLEDAVTVLVHSYMDRNLLTPDTSGGGYTLAEIKGTIKGLLFDYAISSERLSIHRRGTSQRYETRLRNCFSSCCDLRDLKDVEDRPNYFIVLNEEEKGLIPRLFEDPPSEYSCVTMEEYRISSIEYSPKTNPLPHYALISKVKDYLPRFTLNKEALNNLRRCSVFLGVPTKVLREMPI
nr:RNA-dependent RNA polymerase [Phytomonas serpens narnavirus 1]